jgi:hypothetical protein
VQSRYLIGLFLLIILISGCTQEELTDLAQKTGDDLDIDASDLPPGLIKQDEQAGNTGTPAPIATVTLNQAIDVMVSEVAEKSANKESLLIYTWPEQLQQGDLITTTFGAEFVYDIESPSWFFWIDEFPGTRFGHKNTFVLVDAVTQEMKVSEHDYWPYVNEFSMRHDLSESVGLAPSSPPFDIASGWFTLASLQSTVTQDDVRSSSDSACPCTDPKKYALVVAGEYEPGNGFTADAANMSNYLSGQGYEVHQLQPQAAGTTAAGQSGSTSTGAASPENIKAKIGEIAGKIRCCDEFLLYFSTHAVRGNCQSLEAIYQGNNPNGPSLDHINSTSRGIGGVGGSKVEDRGLQVGPSRVHDLCLKIDPPIKTKYQLEGQTTRGIGGLSGSKVEAQENVQVSGNPAGGFMGADELDGLLDDMEHCCNVTVIIDTCYAGAAIPRLAQEGRTIIAATGADQTAAGSPNGGVFTTGLISKLEDGAGGFDEATEELKPELANGTAQRGIGGLGGSKVTPPPQYSEVSKTPCTNDCCSANGDATGTDDVVDTDDLDDTSDCSPNWECTSWGEHDWSACSSGQRSGTKTRVCTDANSCADTSNKPTETAIDMEACGDSNPACSESWTCNEWGSWNTCSNSSQSRTRTCTDANSCGTTTIKPEESQSQSCTPACTENWSCGSYGSWSAWTTCGSDEMQSRTRTRTCTDTNSCGTTASKPAETESGSQSCEYTPTEQKAEYSQHESDLGSNISNLAYNSGTTAFDLTTSGGEYGYRVLTIPAGQTIKSCVAAVDPVGVVYYPRYHFGFDFTDTDPGCTEIYNKNNWANGVLIHLGDPNTVQTTGQITLTDLGQ